MKKIYNRRLHIKNRNRNNRNKVVWGVGCFETVFKFIYEKQATIELLMSHKIEKKN